MQSQLALIRSLGPGKVGKATVENTKEARRAFKVAMTRLGNDQSPKIGLEMWGDETHIYIKRVPHKDDLPTKTKTAGLTQSEA
jgi:hypothetical protein